MTITYDYTPQTQSQQAGPLLTGLRAIAEKGQENVFLLIDREALPEDVKLPFITALAEQRPVPVRLPHRKISMDRYPWLIKLDLTQPAHHALLELSVFHAQEELHPDRLCNGGGRAVCGWLTSPYDTSTLAKQLGHTAIQRLISGQQILLRYYDPAIHSALWQQLNDLQRERWLGGLSGWHYLNGDSQLISHCHTASPYALMAFSLMLSPEDEFRIVLCSKICRTLECYRQTQINQPRHDEATAILLVRDALNRAKQLHGFNEEADQQALALDCLQWHPKFDTHRRLLILLSPREREPEADYVACVAALSDKDRQQICHELNTEETGALAPDARSRV